MGRTKGEWEEEKKVRGGQLRVGREQFGETDTNLYGKKRIVHILYMHTCKTT